MLNCQKEFHRKHTTVEGFIQLFETACDSQSISELVCKIDRTKCSYLEQSQLPTQVLEFLEAAWSITGDEITSYLHRDWVMALREALISTHKTNDGRKEIPLCYREGEISRILQALMNGRDSITTERISITPSIMNFCTAIMTVNIGELLNKLIAENVAETVLEYAEHATRHINFIVRKFEFSGMEYRRLTRNPYIQQAIATTSRNICIRVGPLSQIVSVTTLVEFGICLNYVVHHPDEIIERMDVLIEKAWVALSLEQEKELRKKLTILKEKRMANTNPITAFCILEKFFKAIGPLSAFGKLTTELLEVEKLVIERFDQSHTTEDIKDIILNHTDIHRYNTLYGFIMDTQRGQLVPLFSSAVKPDPREQYPSTYVPKHKPYWAYIYALLVFDRRSDGRISEGCAHIIVHFAFAAGMISKEEVSELIRIVTPQAPRNIPDFGLPVPHHVPSTEGRVERIDEIEECVPGIAPKELVRKKKPQPSKRSHILNEYLERFKRFAKNLSEPQIRKTFRRVIVGGPASINWLHPAEYSAQELLIFSSAAHTIDAFVVDNKQHSQEEIFIRELDAVVRQCLERNFPEVLNTQGKEYAVLRLYATLFAYRRFTPAYRLSTNALLFLIEEYYKNKLINVRLHTDLMKTIHEHDR